MLRTNKELGGCRLAARDGEIGHVKDFYFDDQDWTVRYLVADTGHWLPHRKVLISPFAVTGMHTEPHRALEVNLTRKQIEDSPSIEAHKPVSRQFEMEYAQHFGWPLYWPGPLLWGPVDFPGPYALPSAGLAVPKLPSPPAEDSHLRSVQEVTGYRLQALDAEFGVVEEFLLQSENWAIRYLVVDTGHWWSNNRVLLSPQWIAWVSWTEMRVYVDFDRATIQRAPSYERDKPVTREYEQELFEAYGREPYWHPEPAVK